MAVLRLVRRDNHETVEMLEWLLLQARLGVVQDLALCYRTDGEVEQAAFTGAYRAHPAMAVNAAMRLSWKLTQMQDGAQF